MPLAKTSAPLAALYLVTCTTVEPGCTNAPLFWMRLPETGLAARVVTPEGSAPLTTRASHSQPTMPWPMFANVPGARSSTEVCRQTGSWPWAALTRSG